MPPADQGFGDVPPEHFIPLAEENGMILQIGDRVLALAQALPAEDVQFYYQMGHT